MIIYCCKDKPPHENIRIKRSRVNTYRQTLAV